MNYILKILILAIAVYAAAEIIPGVQVESFWIAILSAFVISVLNTWVRPILIFLTIPATLITLGLFLVVINAVIILMADYFIDLGFEVNGFWVAVLFSIVVSLFTRLIERVTGQKERERQRKRRFELNFD